ncbi:MAG: cytochrome C oxidase subunit IV family protein [Rhodocyclaceae bacterium]|nr:cytochrome C oxidase subunit IV family protein [Rhodocyclaceae bacterium]
MNRSVLNLVWVALMAATLLTWGVGKTIAMNATFVMGVLVLAGLKGWLIIEEFMALRRVRWFWRGLLLGWLMLTLFVIFFAYGLSLR